MRQNRHRLSNQIMGIQTPKKTRYLALDFESIIEKQQQVILKLQKQIKLLRQYIKFFVNQSENHQQLFRNFPLKNEKNQSVQKYNHKQNMQINRSQGGGLKKLVKEIMNILQVKNLEEVSSQLKNVIEKANRKLQPVFVQRIKYKQVPVPMQVIKQVQKQVIVYQQKIIQVPVFKQKIVERYIVKPPQPTNKLEKLFISQQNNSYLHSEQKQEQDFRSKPNLVNSPKYNQTFASKSSQYKQKDEYRQKWDRVTNIKSPRYRQKDKY